MNRAAHTRRRLAMLAAAVGLSTRPAAAQAPPVIDTGGPYVGPVGAPITFRAQATTSIPIINWTWSFGDGTTGTGNIVQHTYNTAGVFTVTLTVINNNGQTASATTTASVGLGVVGSALGAVSPYTGCTLQPVVTSFGTVTYQQVCGGAVSPYGVTTYPYGLVPYPYGVTTYPFMGLGCFNQVVVTPFGPSVRRICR
jgi:hypothetical protein